MSEDPMSLYSRSVDKKKNKTVEAHSTSKPSMTRFETRASERDNRDNTPQKELSPLDLSALIEEKPKPRHRLADAMANLLQEAKDRSSKTRSEEREMSELESISLESNKLEAGELPENWRERLAQMQSDLKKLCERGSKVPERYGMNEHEFEAYMNNAGNFTREQWEQVHQAKELTADFLSRVSKILKNSESEKKPVKKRSPISRGWISID